LVVAGTWAASLHVLGPDLRALATLDRCHEDRIMGLDATAARGGADDAGAGASAADVLVATASLDGTAKLFRIRDGGEDGVSPRGQNGAGGGAPGDGDGADDDDVRAEDVGAAGGAPLPLRLEEVSHLRGHAARLCRVSFHPMGRHAATTSYDHTWRLWDAETSQQLLLQDGHARECYGVGFHPDGGLAATTDLGGVVHVWDLRTSKSIAWHRSHAGRVLNAEFHPANGFQLATAGEDGAVHVFDLRRRRRPRASSASSATAAATASPLVSIPAHSGIVTGLRFDPASGGEFLCTSGFDGAARVWSARSWRLVRSLRGHHGKVSGADAVALAPNAAADGGGDRGDGDGGADRDRPRTPWARPAVVTAGFDRTVKLWK
jgi:U4/U6 small nuclear ribonucleoprotein PRP4